MVRFARSEGSKGSNKKVLGEATAWSDMVTQMKNKGDATKGLEDIGEEKHLLSKENISENKFSVQAEVKQQENQMQVCDSTTNTTSTPKIMNKKKASDSPGKVIKKKLKKGSDLTGKVEKKKLKNGSDVTGKVVKKKLKKESDVTGEVVKKKLKKESDVTGEVVKKKLKKESDVTGEVVKKKLKKESDVTGEVGKKKLKKESDLTGKVVKKKLKKKGRNDSESVAETKEDSEVFSPKMEPQANEEDETTDSPAPFKKKKKGSKKGQVTKNVVIENGQKYRILSSGKKVPFHDISFESESMERYEGFWVKPEMVQKLNDLKNTLMETTHDPKLVRKKMMKAKRKAHRDVTKELVNKQIQEQKENEIEKDDIKKVDIKKEEIKKEEIIKEEIKKGFKLESVFFDGFWVTKEGAERLRELEANLRKRGASKDIIANTIKMERRKEEKILRRLKKSVCYRCRRGGHTARDCREVTNEYTSQNYGICYACGSTEHGLNDCPQKGKVDVYPHATCYYCKQVGHLARQCPQNPRGLYPNGGSCRGCGAVDHLAANCPVIKMEEDKTNMKVGLIDGNALEALDAEHEDLTVPNGPPIKKQKIVKTVAF